MADAQTDAPSGRDMIQPYEGPVEGPGIAAHGRTAEDGLRAAMGFAEMIVDTVREGLLVLDLDLCVQAANESFYRMFGKTREETEGRRVYDLDTGVWDAPELRVLLERVLPERHVFDDFEVEVGEGEDRRVYHLNGRQLNHHQMVLLAATDVTERVVASRSLAEREVTYRALFSSIDEGFALCEMITDEAGVPVDYRFLDANPAFTAMTGLDVAGRTVREVLPGVEDAWVERFARVGLGGESIRFEQETQALGQIFSVYATPVEPVGGGRFTQVFSDVTGQRQAEAALRASEARFRDTANAAPAMLWITGPDGACTFLSRGWYEYTGQTEAEGIGVGWLDAVHPDDREEAGRTFLDAHARREPFALDHRLRRTDGAYRWVVDAGRPLLDEDGDLISYVGSVLDIHDRKEAEEALRRSAARDAFRARLADAIRPLADADAIQAEAALLLGEHLAASRAFYAVVDPDTEHVTISREYASGVSSASTVGTYILSDYGPSVAAEYRAGRTRRSDDTGADPLLTASGRAAYAAIGVGAYVGVPLVKGGRLVGLLGVNQSTARAWTAEEVALVEETAERTWAAVERARAEAEVRTINATLESRVVEGTRQVRMLASKLAVAEQEERERIALVLHDDLQQHLFGASIALSLLTKTDLTEEQETLFGRVHRAVEHGTKLARSLAAELSPSVLDSDDAGAVIRWLAERKREIYGLDVTVEGDAAVPDRPTRLLVYNLVRELLFNVAKHAGTDQARVVLSEADGHVVVRVEDDGAGFDAGARTAGGDGGGFGLASVRERLEAVGGSLDVTSAPGEGTWITLTVPGGQGN